MNRLNEFLQQLISASGMELHLEPNKPPFIVSATGNTEISSAPLPGPQINSMIFSLIPAEVKRELPNKSEVEFLHAHNLGSFTFLVKKSPSGFIVTISPDSTTASSSSAPNEPRRASGEPVQTKNSAEMFRPLVVSPDSGKTSAPTSGAREPSEEEKAAAFEKIFSEELSETGKKSGDEASSRKTDFDRRNDLFTENRHSGAGSENFFQNRTQPPENRPQTAVRPENDLKKSAAPLTPANESGSSAAHPTAKISENGFSRSIASDAAPDPQARLELDELFRRMAELGASDLHLSVSMPPVVRKDGRIKKLEDDAAPLDADQVKRLLTSIMPAKNIEEFAARSDTDFAYEIEGLARFRANIFMDRKGMGGVFRLIPSEILTAEDLNLSKHILDLCDLSKGLVVVTGPTGSGKSTTLCAMIDYVNKRREDHIITIEDPIEFTHENQKCLVNQREVHNHTSSFKNALRAALREDPDILLVGEMRDLETISIAIETAETGHLVFGTLHTTTAASTVDRIIDQFPADRQQQIRVMLSESLRGVIAQTLLPKKGGGRVAALEVLIVTPAISNLIREGKTFQIASAMQTGKNKGMVLLNDALMDLVNKEIVEPRDAYLKAVDKTGFEAMLNRGGFKF